MDISGGNNDWDLSDFDNDFMGYLIEDGKLPPSDLWLNPTDGLERGLVSEADSIVVQQGAGNEENSRKRGRMDGCGRGTKADRERLRREKMNERFVELSSVVDPGRPARSDKVALLADTIRIINQLRNETQELQESNERLQEEIKGLKAEKNELRDEKLALKADKERMEQQMKGKAPASFLPAPPAAYHLGANKMPVFPSYGFVPMWQYLPPSSVDTTRDHELRPPAA